MPMALDLTPHLELAYLSSAQAQKHVTVNDALRRLSGIVQLSVTSANIASQPSNPVAGDRYMLPTGKSGTDWDHFQVGSIAYFIDGNWFELVPTKGWLCSLHDTLELSIFDGTNWTLISSVQGEAMLTKILDSAADGTSDASNSAALDPRDKMDFQIDLTGGTPTVTLYGRLDPTLPWIEIDEVTDDALVTHHWHPYVRAVVSGGDAVIHVLPV